VGNDKRRVSGKHRGKNSLRHTGHKLRKGGGWFKIIKEEKLTRKYVMFRISRQGYHCFTKQRKKKPLGGGGWRKKPDVATSRPLTGCAHISQKHWVGGADLSENEEDKQKKGK